MVHKTTCKCEKEQVVPESEKVEIECNECYLKTGEVENLFYYNICQCGEEKSTYHEICFQHKFKKVECQRPNGMVCKRCGFRYIYTDKFDTKIVLWGVSLILFSTFMIFIEPQIGALNPNLRFVMTIITTSFLSQFYSGSIPIVYKKIGHYYYDLVLISLAMLSFSCVISLVPDGISPNLLGVKSGDMVLTISQIILYFSPFVLVSYAQNIILEDYVISRNGEIRYKIFKTYHGNVRENIMGLWDLLAVNLGLVGKIEYRTIEHMSDSKTKD